MKHRELPHLPGTPASKASISSGAVVLLFRGALKSRLLIFGLLTLVASLAGAQAIFNCSSGFNSSPLTACGVAIPPLGTYAGTFKCNTNYCAVSGTQFDLIQTGTSHGDGSIVYQTAENVQAFSSTFRFVPNGWNLAFVMENNTTGYDGAGPAFAAGAGCETGFYQIQTVEDLDMPNNIFALTLNQYEALADANIYHSGGNGVFTYSSMNFRA